MKGTVYRFVGLVSTGSRVEVAAGSCSKGNEYFSSVSQRQRDVSFPAGLFKQCSLLRNEFEVTLDSLCLRYRYRLELDSSHAACVGC
jgi:hypothetical protein